MNIIMMYLGRLFFCLQLKSLDRELNAFMKKMKQTRIKDVEELLKKSPGSGDGKAQNNKESQKTEGEGAKKEEGNKETKDETSKKKTAEEGDNETQNEAVKEEL